MKNPFKKIDMTLSPTREFEGIPYEVVHRGVRKWRVEFKEGKLRVIVPRSIDPLKILHNNKNSILKKYYQVNSRIEAARQTQITERNSDEFISIVSYYVDQYARRLKVKKPEIKFRKMKRRWGSCRTDGIITLNVFLKFVPEHLISYIIFHELSHFLVRGHGRSFKNIIAAEFPNYRNLDRELNLFALKLFSVF